MPPSKGPSELSSIVKIKVRGEEKGCTARPTPSGRAGTSPGTVSLATSLQGHLVFCPQPEKAFRDPLCRFTGCNSPLKWGPVLFCSALPPITARTIILKANFQHPSTGITLYHFWEISLHAVGKFCPNWDCCTLIQHHPSEPLWSFFWNQTGLFNILLIFISSSTHQVGGMASMFIPLMRVWVCEWRLCVW